MLFNRISGNENAYSCFDDFFKPVYTDFICKVSTHQKNKKPIFVIYKQIFIKN